MVSDYFDWHSLRSKKARLGRSLRIWLILLWVLFIILPVLGLALLYVGMPVGWLLIGLSAPFFMVVMWHKYDLSQPKRSTELKKVDDWLDPGILSLLPEKPSPKVLSEIVGSTPGGLFFGARFGIVGSFLRDLLSDDPSQTADIFAESIVIAKELNAGRISAGIIILAILRQLPENVRLTLLGHLQLTEADIQEGVFWHHHQDMYREAQQRRLSRGGGIGRDWSFGWIPNLSHFGTNISRSSSRGREEMRKEIFTQLVDSLAKGGGAIALVGNSGVGKTELVYELADALMYPDQDIPKNLHYQQVFLLSSSRLLSAAGENGNVGGLIELLLGEAFQAKNIIVCLDNAELFFQQGIGSVDLTSTLLPIFTARRIPIIMTFDEQKYLQLTKRNPEMSAVIKRINVPEPSEQDAIRILQEHVPFIEYKHKVTIMYQALIEAYRLGKRYVYDVAMPGQAISLLESSADFAESGLVSLRSVHKAIESTTGIKTAIADDDSEKELLLNLEERLHERMVGQVKAVRVVADSLRRARAGVRNQSRPVGTFLFLGPTGVGKTELAKSLADVYFGGEENLIRLDMNEFVMPEDVTRLIADGAENPNSLTAQVMKKPFSVILLDELEKAHSSVLATLLQLLDEGVLRDERNREISFRDTIVIATSNAGSDRIQEYISRGYSLEQFEESFVNELIGGHVFAPEFLNRFDEITVFGTLSKQELLQVVDKILSGINKTLSGQNISVTVEPAAKEYLVEQGYDPRLGARPLRRVVQRAVESTVATMLLSGEAMPGSTVELTLDRIQGIIETKTIAEDIISSNKE